MAYKSNGMFPSSKSNLSSAYKLYAIPNKPTFISSSHFSLHFALKWNSVYVLTDSVTPLTGNYH